MPCLVKNITSIFNLLIVEGLVSTQILDHYTRQKKTKQIYLISRCSFVSDSHPNQARQMVAHPESGVSPPHCSQVLLKKETDGFLYIIFIYLQTTLALLCRRYYITSLLTFTSD